MAVRLERGSRLSARRAVEALRNGVPNREAVRELGCGQQRAESRFIEMLDGVVKGSEPPAKLRGMLILGDFGTGKSHLLTHMEHLALSRNFVCSKVAISKETPLYDLGKVFASAIENARMPDRSGRLVEELALAIDPASKAYANFFEWAEDAASSGRLSLIFPASLRVYERSDDFALNGDIESFWAGGRIAVSRIKTGLRQIGEGSRGRFRAPKAADLPPQRLRFAVELVKGVGYRGWVVLLDEIELVGSYSILQRGRSYAEVARWMGRARDEIYPGMVVVGAVTDDFATKIISPDGMKKNRDYIRPKLEGSPKYGDLVSRSQTGMDLLEREGMTLKTPDEDGVRAIMEKLSGLYGRAYDCCPPAPAATDEGPGIRKLMRHKVRTAINEWDLHRLHPGSRPDIETEEFTHTYEENRDLERESRDDPE